MKKVPLRWQLLAVLFVAMTVNIVDRNVISFIMLHDGFKQTLLGTSVLGPAERGHFKELMGLVDMFFRIAYALGFVLFGWLIDRMGTRRGFSVAIAVWSVASMAHAFVANFWQVSAARFVLGLGESGGIPAAVKTIGERFAPSDRSFAMGWIAAGVNMGVIVTALVVPSLIESVSWRTTFFLTGGLGLVVLVLWLFVNRGRPKPLPEPLADPATPRFSWKALLTYRQTWAFAAGKFFTDAVWWFYLSWLPTFFNENPNFNQKLDLTHLTGPLLVIYLASDAGSIFFGWLATKLQKVGWSVGRARKTTMFLTALCALPIGFASVTNNLVVCVALISLATAGHQGWSTNLLTLPSDLFPQRVVGSVTGIGSMFGAVGGVLLASASGFIITRSGYAPLFLGASLAYLLAWGCLVFLVPKFDQPTALKTSLAHA